jgi:hypothetical protein
VTVFAPRHWIPGAASGAAVGLAGVAVALALVAAPDRLAAQGAAGDGEAAFPNYVLPPAELEARLADDPFQIVGMRDNRWQGDRTQQTDIRFPDGLQIRVKWAKAPPGGFAINNQPRYELAAYEFQKLLYDAPDRVVPPTVIRELPLRAYRQLDPEMGPTFEGTASVLVAVQYWLQDVDAEEAVDTARLETDPTYARRMGYLNLFTHLIRHVDSNPGNVLISTVDPPRLFAVDNGVAFRSPVSPRGTLWRDLHVRRVPATAVARLRSLTRAELNDALYVVAQFRVGDDGRLEPVAATAKLDENRGVPRQGDVIQFGLTNLEVDGIWARIQAVLDRVDAGDLETF